MTHQELREKYLKFFEEKGHKRIPSAPLIPENDATVLFTTAGMHPLVPFLLGEKHPAGDKLTSCQKCVRTGDIEEVGDDVHLTFFEMLGNWGLGSYWKKEAIEWSWEFLTDKKWLGLDKEKLAVSVFAGDLDAPFDEESYNIWKNLGISERRIVKLPKSNNWWGPAGQTGPCGPDTEMFYWTGDGKAPEVFDSNDVKWVEIWNDVFMQYNKVSEGKFEPLKQKNVDTGMGLERTLAVLNGKKDVYETELFSPIIKEIEKLSGKKYQDYQKEFRIIADHIKAITFILAEGLEPFKEGRGSVLRKLIRIFVDNIEKLGIIQNDLIYITSIIIEIYRDVYPELYRNKDFINNELMEEIKRYNVVLDSSESVVSGTATAIAHLATGVKSPYTLVDDMFKLRTERGIPFQDIKEKYENMGIEISDDAIEKYNEKIQKHQELSRTASAGMFKGGLADNSEMVVKYHTTTHLLHAALRKVLGQEVEQKGSNLNAERLRFDFSYGQKMTSEQIKQVEDLVNEKIHEKLDVKMGEMSLEEAKKSGAIGLFAEKYGDKVKVYSIDGFSKEICGGPHVENIGTLGHFKIIKEEAVSAGVRRIKAILE